MRRTASLLALTACLAACAPSAGNRDALRTIVQTQCAPGAAAGRGPAPCERVVPPAAPGGLDGYAVLHDRKGGAHFLIIPTATLRGVESPELQSPDTPDSFADAWRARDLLDAAAGHSVPRDDVGLALNPRSHRSQDQLHIHLECLKPAVRAALREAWPRMGGAWAPLDVGDGMILGMRLTGESLTGANPVARLAAGRPESRGHMSDYGFLVAGMGDAERPGFALLALEDRAAELLLDSTCASGALK